MKVKGSDNQYRNFQLVTTQTGYGFLCMECDELTLSIPNKDNLSQYKEELKKHQCEIGTWKTKAVSKAPAKELTVDQKQKWTALLTIAAQAGMDHRTKLEQVKRKQELILESGDKDDR